ncbi:Tn3 family transposase [Streptomyces sp. NPDC059906]|uniref:Tn3 family transposase n=1 Tax=Streptomyces sp. NPDC059906 TaxID=3346997 RepID=UPI00365F4D61
MGCFPKAEDILKAVAEFVRRAVELPEGTLPVYRGGEDREEPPGAGSAAGPCGLRPGAGLINIALEKVVEAGLELPAFSTFGTMASALRKEVNAGICGGIHDRKSAFERAGLLRLPEERESDDTTLYNRLKKPSQGPTWSHFKNLAKPLEWVDGLGDTGVWMDGVAAGKITDFAGETDAARPGGAAGLQAGQAPRAGGVLAHKARMRVRDDLATMFCKRVAMKIKKAKVELEGIRLAEREIVEALIGNYRTLLKNIDEGGPAQEALTKATTMTAEVRQALEGLDEQAPLGEVAVRREGRVSPAVLALVKAQMVQAGGFGAVTKAVEGFDGFARQCEQIEKVSAHHGNFWEVLLCGQIGRDRAVMFDWPKSWSSPRRRRTGWCWTRSRTRSGTRRRAASTSVPWARTAVRWTSPSPRRTGRRPSSTGRGRGSSSAGTSRRWSSPRSRRNCAPGMWPWWARRSTWTGRRSCRPGRPVQEKPASYLVAVGLCEEGEAAGFDAAFFHRQLEDKLRGAAAAADAGYPDNEGLFIDPETGIPSLKAHRAEGQRPSAKRLEEEIKARMPERSLMGILVRTAYWVEWWRPFGPACGNEPKLADPFGRYVITTFVKGTNMCPYEAARHIPRVSGHELAYTANRRFSLVLLNETIADLVNAHARLDISQAWGDGTAVADNLLTETSVQYGKPGGIASTTSRTPTSRCSRTSSRAGCGRRVYIIEGLLKSTPEVKPTTVHADTQSQSQPVFALAHLLGFDLMPRIRNWKGMAFNRPSKTTEYVHIDALFGEPGKNSTDFDLNESQFRDLMRVAVFVREGAISSSTLLKRLRSGSKKNATYAAFREVGRVIRTVQLLRYLSDAPLRRRVTAATNKVESFNRFSQWIGFGNRGVIAGNDPVEQEKAMKFNALLTNAVIFHNALGIAEIVRQLLEEGWTIDPEELAHISPYLTEHINRFGEYSTHELGIQPDAYDPKLDADFTPLREQEPSVAGFGQAA